MNQNVLVVSLFIIILIIWLFTKNTKGGGMKMSPADAKKRLENEEGIVLLDVRNLDEHVRRHIPRSTLIPVNILESEAEKRLPNKNTEIFVYCAGGNRSRIAVNILLKLGYTRVNDLGGIVNWPYETASGSK